MQMYEGLPIATNKLPTKDREAIPHHLLGCLPVNETPWTVEHFRRRAMGIIDEVKAKGKLPILVGGTHYYLHSLLFQNSTLGETDSWLSDILQEQRWPILRESTKMMFAELKKVDPVMAGRWHPNDRRHIRRNLEIWLTTGRRPSDIYADQYRQKSALRPADKTQSNKASPSGLVSMSPLAPLCLWIHSSPEELRARLDSRVLTMINEGLLSEVAAMHALAKEEEDAGRIVSQDRGIWVSIGYKELIPYVLAAQQSDQPSPKALEKLRLECIEATQAHTRQYAKSQVRWIRLKFLHELRQYGAEKSLFLLDGTHIENWHMDVEKKAHELTSKFLNGEAMPDPCKLSPLASEMLSAVEEEDERIAMHCEYCRKTLMGQKQWDAHIFTKKHKATVKSHLKTKPTPLDVNSG